MNTTDVTSDQSHQPIGQTVERPLGSWLRTVDHSIKRSMHDALTEDGLGRRAWRTLSVIESGATSVDEIDAALPPRRRSPHGPGRRRGFGPGRGFGRPDGAERPERDERSADATVGADASARPESAAPPKNHEHGHPLDGRGINHERDTTHERHFGPGFRPGAGGPFRPGFERAHVGGAPFGHDFRGQHGPRGRRRSTEEVVLDFAARGWVTIDAAGITLTDAGREAHAALRTKVDAVRQTVTDAVSPEDLATTLASLESIARAFGWDEQTAREHGPRGRFGRGPRGNR
ncbi:hypothetical protein KXS11_16550 [Plantibacter flavus]|uniref:hypothetical protein n=1 Tax=Plantibacter flavus TaxID=150123 RepID=UPI003F169D10